MTSAWRRRIAMTLVGGMAIAMLLTWLAGSGMVQGSAARIAPASPPARDLMLRSTGGIQLAATYRPGNRANAPGVLLLHGVGASRAAAMPTARWLGARGYAVLALDFRGHGGSTTTQRSFGWHESADAHAGFAWLKRRQGGARVAVIGVSMGGAAALIGPAGPVPADALVLQAVYPDIRHAIHARLRATLGPLGAMGEPLLSFQSLPRFGVLPGRLSPVMALRDFRAPVLVIGGGEDRYTPPEETRMLYAAAPRGKRMMWLAPGADHGATSVLDTPEYRAVVANFLQQTVGR